MGIAILNVVSLGDSTAYKELKGMPRVTPTFKDWAVKETSRKQKVIKETQCISWKRKRILPTSG